MIAQYDLLALIASFCYAFSAIYSAKPAKHLGANEFVRWRMSVVMLILWLITLIINGIPHATFTDVLLMIASGIFGVFIGDISFYSAMNQIGPRRTSIIQATNALFGVILGYLFLSERLGFIGYVGAVVTVAGVMVALAI